MYLISSVRNLCCVCCDSAIMSGEGGGSRQGERERQGLFQYENCQYVRFLFYMIPVILVCYLNFFFFFLMQGFAMLFM